MRKASEYLEHARECRELASKMEKPQAREQLLKMARHWEQLALDRERMTRNERPAE